MYGLGASDRVAEKTGESMEWNVARRIVDGLEPR